ncbi:MAG: ABC transporter ATP-binding protein [Myxococcota bacterium]
MIHVDHVSKYYGPRAAVSELSFEIARGEVIGLLGLNGAGKTTTLRMLAGVLLPTAGQITIDGFNLATDPEDVRSRIGFLPETPPVYPEMTVDDYLRFVAHIKGLRKDVAPAIQRTLEATDLVDVRHRPIGALSHGFKRRVGIAQAVVHSPKLILLDEPTSGLDPVQIVHMRKLIKGLRENHTVIVSSHILSEIGQLCDRIFVLQSGRLVAEGTDRDLAAQVRSGTSVRLEVTGERAAVEKTLNDHSIVRECRVISDEHGVLELSVELVADEREALARLIVEAGFGLRRLERVRMELENIFLELTGHGEVRESEAPPAETAA